MLIALKELHGFGARRIAFLSLPPVGCVPTSRTLSGGKNRTCARHYNQAAKIFNKKLSSELDSLRSKNPPVNAVLADIYSPLIDIIENPQSYGNLSFQIDVVISTSLLINGSIWILLYLKWPVAVKQQIPKRKRAKYVKQDKRVKSHLKCFSNAYKQPPKFFAKFLY